MSQPVTIQQPQQQQQPLQSPQPQQRSEYVPIASNDPSVSNFTIQRVSVNGYVKSVCFLFTHNSSSSLHCSQKNVENFSWNHIHQLCFSYLPSIQVVHWHSYLVIVIYFQLCYPHFLNRDPCPSKASLITHLPFSLNLAKIQMP